MKISDSIQQNVESTREKIHEITGKRTDIIPSHIYIRVDFDTENINDITHQLARLRLKYGIMISLIFHLKHHNIREKNRVVVLCDHKTSPDLHSSLLFYSYSSDRYRSNDNQSESNTTRK